MMQKRGRGGRGSAPGIVKGREIFALILGHWDEIISGMDTEDMLPKTFCGTRSKIQSHGA